jgi:hypothetical protein
MKKLILIFAVMMLIAGCGPIKKDGRIIRDECSPLNLTVSSDNQKLFLRWETDCPENILTSGYYIYVQNKPLDTAILTGLPPSKIQPFNHTAYPGDTDPDNSYETMAIENLDNGVEYFVSVRTAFPDKSLSQSSNQVAVMCRPEGIFELAFRYAAENDGFSFNLGKTVRADAEENDLYFFSKDGLDFIGSPHRLNGFIRKSGFYSLGKTNDIYHYPSLDLDYQPSDKMPVNVGESYLIKTADNRYAKIRIESASGELRKRVIKISYIYQTRKNLMRF